MDTRDAKEAMMKNIPQGDRAVILETGERLIAARFKQAQLQQDLQHAMIQEWSKMDEISLNFDSMRSLMRAYHIAVEGSHDTFKWEGKEFVTAYAKYLLEYAENRIRMDAGQKLSIRQLRATHARIMSNRETGDAKA